MTKQERLACSSHQVGDSSKVSKRKTPAIAVFAALLSVTLLAAGSAAWSQNTLRFEPTQTAHKEGLLAGHTKTDDPVSALADYVKASFGARSPHGVDAHEGYHHLSGHAREAEDEQPQLISADQSAHALAGDSAFAALAAFAAQLEAREPVLQFAQATQAKPAKAKAPAKAPSDGEATLVGSQACIGCHAAQTATFNQTIMGRIFRNPRNASERGGCETCHGPGSLHVKLGGGRGVGGLISFRKDDKSYSVAETNGICMSCHDKGGHLNWKGSTHETRDVGCTNCHTVMANVSLKSNLKTAVEVDTCAQCHKNKRAEMWRSSHMPVREGKMTCSSCHNPHGSFGEASLKNAATINDNCYKCHAEKRGPFLFEHAPVRENCTYCHEPHGSTNDFLLKISRPRLCQQCHSALSGHPANPRNPTSVYAINRECQNCHSQVHGSNSPSGGRFAR